MLVHLAGTEVGIVKHSQMVGIQGKRRVVQRNVDPGIGAGRINKMAYPSYTYAAQPGFAEHDLDEYDRISAELAWSRSLAAARKAFHTYTNMELTLDENIQSESGGTYAPYPPMRRRLTPLPQASSSPPTRRTSCPATPPTRTPT